MKKLLIFITLVTIGWCNSSIAQTTTEQAPQLTESLSLDTVYIPAEAIEQLGDTPTVFVLSKGEEFYRNKYVQMTYVGVPLVITGVLSQQYVAGKFYDHLGILLL